ncbi:MAG: hypothetical protein ACTHK0_02400, partial [Ginsengibacter sp.]
MKHSGIVTTRYLFLKILKIITIKVICCIVILFQCFTSVAQIGNSDADKIIPANPEASSMARYIDFPVGYNTGVPDISIPLYSVKSEGLTIPIELRYHAGGLKIGQMPTKVGLGWSLSPNLEITRSINGGDDLDPNNGYYYRNEIGPYIENCSTCFPGSTALQLLNLSNNDLDGQADRFQYNLLGKSGIFYFQKYAGGVAKAITVPLTGIKIELVGTNAFKITDTDGTVYWFGSKDAPSTNAFTVRMQNHSTYQSPVVSWKCSEITNPSKTGTIYFSYAYKYEQYSNYHEKIQVFENTNPCQGLGGGTIDAEIVYPGSLQVIENPDGVPNSFNFYQLSCPKYYNNSMGYYDRGFHMVWQSQDEYGNIGTEDTNFPHDFLTPPQVITTEVGLSLNSITFNGGSVVFDESNQLNTIKIFDDNGKEIRTFNFIQSYANS